MKVFNATGNWPVRWRFVLASYHNISHKVREYCGYLKKGRWHKGTLICDSVFSDPSITNQQLYEKAITCGADVIVPKDFPGDWEMSVQSAFSFVEKYGVDWKARNGQILFALQYPYEASFQALAKLGDWFGLGGLLLLKDKQKQFDRIREGVEIIGKTGKQCHLFGIYPSPRFPPLLEYLQNNPYIQSFDTTVLEANAKHGIILDKTLNPYHVGKTLGKHCTPAKYILAEYNLTMLSLKLNHPDFGARTKARGGAFIHVKRPKMKPSKSNQVKLF